MRISDWSSDVCSSDLLNGEVQINDDWSTYFSTNVTNASSFGRYAPVPGVVVIAPDAAQNPVPGATPYLYHRFAAAGNRDTETNANAYAIMLGFRGTVEIGNASGRERVCPYV